MREIELRKSELQELKKDLIEGKNLSSVFAVKHPKNNPQRIIYTIVKLCVASNGKEAFPYKEILEKYKKGLEPPETKWNPIDHFSQVFTRIDKDIRLGVSEEAEDIFIRWYDIIDRDRSKQTGGVWAYMIKPEFFQEIKKIFLEVEQQN